jgi:hypothetical protein
MGYISKGKASTCHSQTRKTNTEEREVAITALLAVGAANSNDRYKCGVLSFFCSMMKFSIAGLFALHIASRWREADLHGGGGLYLMFRPICSPSLPSSVPGKLEGASENNI